MAEAGVLVAVEDFPPGWAGGWGEDLSGFYAQLVVRGVTIELRRILPGEYQMGSPDGEAERFDDETRHAVRLSRSFWMGRHPVTQAEYEAVMGANPSEFKAKDAGRLPVERVTWDEACESCRRLTCLAREARALEDEMVFRLPTEAEWEYACRAGTESAFNDGSACTKPTVKDPALDGLGWFNANSGNRTHAVGEKATNRWGLYDMHGNVWEWCADWAEWGGQAQRVTNSDGAVDPFCTQGARRVVRGGSFRDYARNCRSANRIALAPGNRSRGLGFRLAAGQELGRGAEAGTDGASGGAGGGAAGAAAPGPEAATPPPAGDATV